MLREKASSQVPPHAHIRPSTRTALHNICIELQSILAVGEAMKLCFSLAMIRRTPTEETEGSSLCQTLRRLAATSPKMAVPAFIFLAMNLLSFVSLSRISASAFSLIQQSKIIFTALLSRVLLNKVSVRCQKNACRGKQRIWCTHNGLYVGEILTGAVSVPGA